MGVNNTKKKIPGWVKRTIRKSVGGLCIASSLIVALIPPTVSEGYSTIPAGAGNYDYGVVATGADDVDLGLGSVDLSLKSDSSTPKYQTKYVRRAGDGSYEYGWQFLIYLQTLDQGSAPYGVICDYNSLYSSNSLTINKSLPYEYVVVTPEEYNSFYAAFDSAKASSSETVSISTKGVSDEYKARYTLLTPADTILPNSDEYFLKKYFTEFYNSFVNDYKTYRNNLALYNTKKAAHDAWAAIPDNTAPEPEFPGDEPTWTSPLTMYVSDIPNTDNTELLKRQYYCEVNKYYGSAHGFSTSLNGYTLVNVKDYVSDISTNSITTNYVYLAQGTPNPNNDANSPNDEFGFYVKNKVDVLAIGNKAFEGTTNVYDLVLSDDMKFIGDEAFSNSFVRSIEFSNVEKIGNRSFKNCSQLSSITFHSGTTVIGTEAFYGCGLNKVIFPYSIKLIGPGAFAANTNLQNLDLSGIAQTGSEISGFAFYDDISLNSVVFSDTISKIGDAAFAVKAGVTGGLTEFTFPANVNTIGDYVLAGRGNLKKVNMPFNLGRSQSPPVLLPENMFRNCFQLECVEFPDDRMGSSGFVNFDTCSSIFSSITNEDFYVRGPELNSNLGTASPRQSTWGKKSGVIIGYESDGVTPVYKPVPYVYIDSKGQEQFEISDGSYLLVIDDAGVLQSCSLVNPSGSETFTMTIPESVGSTKVTGVSSTCFQQQAALKERMTKLVIEDNTISEIAPGAFKGFNHLTSVSIGNSVNSIGASAFEGCDKLVEVSFNTPVNGYASFPVSNIGEKAFETGAEKLTFIGDIDESYGPFVWATDVNNFVDESTGTRVCYKTSYPTYLTVIVDNRNGYPTLVDYPHYEQLNNLNLKCGTDTPVKTIIPNDYVKDGINYPAGTEINTDLITRYENQGKEILDVSTGDVLYTYTVSLKEEKLVDSVLNIDVPSGVKSIDANGFINGTSELAEGVSDTTKNTYNVTLYLQGSDDFLSYRSNGLFNGFFGKESDAEGKREYAPSDPREEISAGNDRVKSITLHTVGYLPEEAFYSCEQLESVVLGSSMSDLGNAPFAGCTKMTAVGSSSEDVVCNNGIIYAVNDDGSYNIVEVLSSRGTLVGSKKIKVSEEDPYLANVKSITPGAFKNCNGITAVDLTGMDMLTEIPEECFMNCTSLNQVVLPDNITSLGKNAFANAMPGVELVIYGREVYMSPATFGVVGSPDYVDVKRVISYADSAARKAAADLGADVSEVLDDTVKVQFYDFDGRELSRLIYVTKGASVNLTDIPADPVRDGYTFTGWNKPLTNIITDSVIVATYKQNPGGGTSGNDPSGNNNNGNNNNGNNNNNNNNSASGNNATKFYTLTVTNGNGSGSYAEGATVIITCTNPPSGQVFDKWVPATNDLGIASVNVAATTLKMPAHEASVTATFKSAPTNTNGNGHSSTSGNNSSNSNNKTNGNTVLISKPGISNTSLASVQVTGSNDNYVVRIAETAAATAAVEKALTNEYGSLDTIRYSAMDITLYDATGTNKITNYSGLSVTITMPIPDVMTQYAGNNKVAGVVNEKLDKLTPKFTTIDGVPCVSFTATHFSPYTIYVDTGNLSETAVIDGSPKTGDGIQPKWFLVAGLSLLGIALFFMKDRKPVSIA